MNNIVCVDMRQHYEKWLADFKEKHMDNDLLDLNDLIDIATSQDNGGFHYEFTLVTVDGREFEASTLDPWCGFISVPFLGEGFTTVKDLQDIGCKAKLKV